jgi:hypothetical protein
MAFWYLVYDQFDMEMIDEAAASSGDPQTVDRLIRHVKRWNRGQEVDRDSLIEMVKNRAEYYRTISNATALKELKIKYKNLSQEIEALAGMFTWHKLN